MTRFCDLPEDVVIGIMSWLPFESLFQCKCVQKSWCALITTLVNNPCFVAKHLRNFECFYTQPSLFLRGYPIYRRAGHSKTINSLLRIQDDGNDYVDSNLKEFIAPHAMTSLGGSHCDGIVCLSDNDTNTILLCNPVLREFKLLDQNTKSRFGRKLKTHMVGFGYDSIANVYKVVRVVRLGGKRTTTGTSRIGVEAHTLGTNYWREIKIMPEVIHVYLNNCNELYYKGVYYWVLYNESSREMSLLSFDMHKEVFQIISSPDGHEE